MITSLGGDMEGRDPNLAEKIAKLKRSTRSPEDNVRRFLEQEIGVDPDKLPFSPVQARDYTGTVIESVEGDRLTFTGNSMGVQQVTVGVYDDQPVVYTSSSPEWHDLHRSYAALVKEFDGFYSFVVEYAYPDVIVKPVEPPPVKHQDPRKYPPGSVLQVQKQSVEGDQLVFDRMYIRIGGLYDDTTPTNLDTMQPINELSGWHVREELS